jgi:tetratricopeptide (TPR) repeat protein
MDIFSSRSTIHSRYDDFVVLFGWDLASLWMTANQKRCHALLQAGRLWEAIGSYQYIMDVGDITTKADALDWSIVVKQECSALCAANGDAAFAASDYNRAIDLYSAAIELDSASDTVFAKRSKAKSEKKLWIEALNDAQKVIELNPSSYLGYNLKHTALHGAKRYDEAIQTFKIVMSKLDDAIDVSAQQLRQQYLSPSEAARDIRKVIDTRVENAPFRVLDTTTGLLCDREAQIRAFKECVEYKKLVSWIITHPDFREERIKETVATYFRYATLSHRWERKEPLLQDIQDKVLYELKSVGGMAKLQSFCKIARRAGYRWAWSDTCCIDKSNSVEHQEAINSMFAWYQHSTLTIIYLSDVPPLSKSGALANSAWIKRGWTAQELLASKVILFYQNDWTLYLDDRCPNHKESVAIMQELQNATGIDRQAIVAFRPGMRCARETLQWASMRVTTLQEDIAYSLSGIFGVRLRVDYGEKKQYALGRLLRKVIAQSGDITTLDWVGKPSAFNSCLPADITSYKAPPCKLPSLSEDDIQSSVSSLRGAVAPESASKLYQTLDGLSAPRFTHRRLHLPCIVFPVTEIRRKPGQNKEMRCTYEVKADGIHDLHITTEDKLFQFSRTMPPPAWRTFLLVRTWTRHLLELPDSADDTESIDDLSVSECTLPSSENGPVYSESHSQALRLIVRLGQPFGAFLLSRQRGGEYKRIASDRNIIAQVRDMTSVGDMMDIRTLEIV